MQLSCRGSNRGAIRGDTGSDKEKLKGNMFDKLCFRGSDMCHIPFGEHIVVAMLTVQPCFRFVLREEHLSAVVQQPEKLVATVSCARD